MSGLGSCMRWQQKVKKLPVLYNYKQEIDTDKDIKERGKRFTGIYLSSLTTREIRPQEIPHFLSAFKKI